MSRSEALEGFRLTAVCGALIALAMAVILALDAISESSIRAVIRLTARSSFALFVLAFTASGAARLLPGTFTRWQLRNRRYLGLSFAASHGLHALAISALAQLYPASFAEHTRMTAVGPGLIAYAFIVAMAATSSDKAAAWLGPRSWKALHVIGGLYIWAAFFKAMLVRTADGPAYWPAVAILIAALILRIRGWVPTRAISSQ